MTTDAAPDLLTRLQDWLSGVDTAWKRDHAWLVAKIEHADELLRETAAELTACRAEQARLQEEKGLNPLDWCSCGHRREAHHAWGRCHSAACKCSRFVLGEEQKTAEAQVTTLTAQLAEQKANRNRDLTTLKHVIQERKTLSAAAEGVGRFFSGEQLGVSTGIDGAPTYGYGHLDAHGFWEFPVSDACAAFNRNYRALAAALRRYGQHEANCKTRRCVNCDQYEWLHDAAEDLDEVTCLQRGETFLAETTCTCGLDTALCAASEGP